MNIDKKLDETRLERNQLKKDSSSLLNLEKRLSHKMQLKKDAVRILNKEEKEFNRINNLSLTSLFYLFLGTKEQKLDKERQEYLLAKLNFDTLEDEILMIESKRSIEQVILFRSKSRKIKDELNTVCNQKKRTSENLNKEKIQLLH